MSYLLHHFIERNAQQTPQAIAVRHKNVKLTYQQVADSIQYGASGMQQLGIGKGDRVAVYLPKLPQTVCALFASCKSGAAMVPINPLLKSEQVSYILQNCSVKLLITSLDRLSGLQSVLDQCPALQHIIVIDEELKNTPNIKSVHITDWQSLLASTQPGMDVPVIDTDMAAILYTSGSTGKPKGVVLSHRNMVCGANSVASYLNNQHSDRLLAVLPFSFDYGLSQLTTAFSSGACVVLMDYLFPRDVVNAVAKYSITGLAAVPPLWIQLARMSWPHEALQNLRYITNSGGVMPLTTLQQLREKLSKTQIYLMYGLTEAFRSTYLPPDKLDSHPTSMGQAIPNAQLHVINKQGEECAANEPGELVHRGSLVAMGYWNDTEKTAQRFKAAPLQNPAMPIKEMAVWSGDTVKRDEEGYFYFVSRDDEMIKTSGYRVSPSEIEETLYQSNMVNEAVVFGIADEELGQSIVAVISSDESNTQVLEQSLLAYCKQHLPVYMVPARFEILKQLPRTPNGKIDRNQIKRSLNQAS